LITCGIEKTQLFKPGGRVTMARLVQNQNLCLSQTFADLNQGKGFVDQPSTWSTEHWPQQLALET
jgi:hypothetical protein